MENGVLVQFIALNKVMKIWVKDMLQICLGIWY